MTWSWLSFFCGVPVGCVLLVGFAAAAASSRRSPRRREQFDKVEIK